MRIKEIKIHDFRGLSDVTIDNLDKNLNLLIGVNGAGKSSVLDATVFLLQAFTARLTTSGSKGASIALADIKRDSRTGCELTLTLDNEVKWTRVRSRKLDKTDESDLSQLNDYTKPLRAQLDERQEIDLPVIVHYGVKRSVTDIPLHFPKSEDSLSNATYKDWVDSKARDIFPWLRGEEDYENELIRDNPEARDRGLEALREAMRVIFPEYTDLRVQRKPHLEVTLRKGGEKLPLSQLSDGEKCYLALVCDIVRRLTIANPCKEEGEKILKGEGIVLIDEVDLHLHPSWEASVMEKLHEVFPNIQFIVSAHSPLVASHFDGQVYGVKNGSVTPLPRLFGLDYSTILQDWMETSPDNREVNAMVDLYRAYTKYNMQAQADEVKAKILELLNGDENALVWKQLQTIAD